MRTKIACKQCGKENSTRTGRNFCSRVCFHQSRIGTIGWARGVKRGTSGMKGKHHTPEAKAKLRLTSTGNKHALGGKGRLGQKHSETAKHKMRLAKLGDKSPAWIDGRSTGNNKHEYYLHQNRLRKARLRGAEGSYDVNEWKALKAQYNLTCPACLRVEPEIKLTADHKVPIRLGGSNYISNIQPLCGSCNSRKHIKIISYAI